MTDVAEKQSDFECRAIVVTLDGSPEAEVVLEPSIKLARKLGATIYLLEVVVPYIPVAYSEMGIGYTYDPDEETEKLRQAAVAYLDRVQALLRDKGIPCQSAVVIGDAAHEIVNYARKVNATMLAMATHARSRIGQLFIGSVAGSVLRCVDIPVMMVHTTAKPTAEEIEKTGIKAQY
jgi:nucleotide-binding universal stress UspA family protein